MIGTGYGTEFQDGRGRLVEVDLTCEPVGIRIGHVRLHIHDDLAGCGKIRSMPKYGRKFPFGANIRITSGCSKRLSSKAAASGEARRTLRSVEPLSDARTPLTDFFSILSRLPANHGRATRPAPVSQRARSIRRTEPPVGNTLRWLPARHESPRYRIPPGAAATLPGVPSSSAKKSGPMPR